MAQDLGAEELVSLGIAPVCKQHLKQAAQRIHVEAVTSQVAPQNETKKKSKKQIKRDRQKLRTESLCNDFSRGCCERGDDCKRSHNLEQFLQNQPPELPGQCPYTNSSSPCQYGLSCRWASTHKDLNEETKSLLQQHNSQSSSSEYSNADIIELPILKQVSEPKNCLDKVIQKKLQQRGYDFSKANKTVEELNILQKRKRQQEENADDEVIDNNNVDQQNQDDQLQQLQNNSNQQTAQDNGYMETGLKPEEIKIFDFKNKLYLAPLTTVGNLPFRYVCKRLGADVTCGEMALATSLLQGQNSEWALMKRHPIEDMFGVQICGGYEDSMSRCAQVVEESVDIDFLDINMGCPIDIICNRGAGSSLLKRRAKMQNIVKVVSKTLSCPLTFKIRKGYHTNEDVAHTFLPFAASWGACAVTLHGRTREQRYSKQADWEYIRKCSQVCQDSGVQLIGNGDIFSYTDYYNCLESGNVDSCMIARGAIIKPWVFTEIKERRHWDISATERLDILKDFCSVGLTHWGSDSRGVEVTRNFLLEWLSYLHRYIPVGLLEVVPQKLHWRPPLYEGRNELESLLSSDNAKDWVKISEMLLGPAPPHFSFSPKHKSNAYATVDQKTYDLHTSNG